MKSKGWDVKNSFTTNHQCLLIRDRWFNFKRGHRHRAIFFHTIWKVHFFVHEKSVFFAQMLPKYLVLNCRFSLFIFASFKVPTPISSTNTRPHVYVQWFPLLTLLYLLWYLLRITSIYKRYILWSIAILFLCFCNNKFH